jgi:hypothetical protein
MKLLSSQLGFFREGKGAFTLPGKNAADIIDLLEDMILMTGCSDCGSLNTRVIITDQNRVLYCLNCGACEEIPPPS